MVVGEPFARRRRLARAERRGAGRLAVDSLTDEREVGGFGEPTVVSPLVAATPGGPFPTLTPHPAFNFDVGSKGGVAVSGLSRVQYRCTRLAHQRERRARGSRRPREALCRSRHSPQNIDSKAPCSLADHALAIPAP